VLAADDDNGDLDDGTPHMTAIFEAFHSHEIACIDPVVQDAGLRSRPGRGTGHHRDPARSRGEPLLDFGTERLRLRRVSAPRASSGATSARSMIGETDGLTWRDTGLQNGRTYSYSVQPIGSDPACLGPMAVCDDAVPAPGFNLSVPRRGRAGGRRRRRVPRQLRGGHDLLHARQHRNGQLTNVRILSVVPVTHPATQVIGTFPMVVAATLDECEQVIANIQVIPQGCPSTRPACSS
jgi:hypothetical protein